MQYFNTILEEYENMDPNGTFNYITKESIDGVQVMLSQVNFKKKYKSFFFKHYIIIISFLISPILALFS